MVPVRAGCTAYLHDFDSKKNQIRDRVDIVDLVSEHVALKRRGSRWVGLCPFHSEKTPSFTVSPDRGTYKCFGCQKSGDVFSFVEQRENVPFMEAMRILADRAGVELGRSAASSATGSRRSDIAKVNEWCTGFFRSRLLHAEIGRDARAYVAGRNINDETAERFGVGLAAAGSDSGLVGAALRAGFDRAALEAADLLRRSEDGRVYETFRHRLMFPIRDATRRVIGFGGRTLGDDRAKYLNTRQNELFDKGRSLYGVDIARTRICEIGRAVVVEGYTDCIAAHQAGFTETVATLGTALTESHVDLLRRYCDEVILMFDSDDAGNAAADRAIRVALPRHLTVRLARIPDKKDPSDLLSEDGADAFSALLNEAEDALEFRWLKLTRRYDEDGSPGGRREAIREFLGDIVDACRTGAVDPIRRGLIVNQVAALVGIATADVHAVMNDLESRKARASVDRAGVAETRVRRPAVNAMQAAWTRVLEVLLDSPDVWQSDAPTPDTSGIADERDRRIAETLFGLLARGTGVTRSDVLAACPGADGAQRVTELAETGERRGNHAATLEVALEQIRSGARAQCIDKVMETEMKAWPTGPPSTDDDPRAVLQRIASGHRHFGPRRKIRQRMGVAGMAGTAGGTDGPGEPDESAKTQ